MAGALGDSGIITTNSKKLYLILKSLRNYGSPKKNYFTHIGLNARIDELQSGFLRTKLKNLDKYNAYRSKIADYYLKKLMDINEIVNTGGAFIAGAFAVWLARIAKRDLIKKRTKK